jgi:hypothetical protein
MSEKKEELIESLKKEVSNQKPFIIRILVVASILLGIYYLTSPYQRCARVMSDVLYCNSTTNW